MMDNKDKNNSEINLNLKIPPEKEDGSFSMKDLVLTVYAARKLFLAWCCIGLLLGIIAAGGYYMLHRNDDVQGDVSVKLTLNYSRAEWNLFPNGEGFSARSFSEASVWENAVKTLGIDDITVGDVINEVKVTREEERYDIYNLTIPYSINVGKKIFANNADKKKFLQTLCKEYKNFIKGKYYTEKTIGKLYEQYLGEIEKQMQDVALWEADPFSFDNNFREIDDYYTKLEKILNSLYSAEPNYTSSEGLSFEDYAKQLYDIRQKGIGSWITKLQYSIYIRNIDKFKEESKYRVAVMERGRDYNLELAASYNELLAAFKQKEAQGVIVPEAVEVLKESQKCASEAADLQKQISQMNYDLAILEENEQSIRANSREAEDAFAKLIGDLKKNQENIRKVVYGYYEQLNKRNGENAILYSNAVVIPPEGQPATAGVSMMRLLMILVGLTFLGFAVGFSAAFIKKYLPAKA